MNDTFRDQTGDDDVRDLLVRAGADAPMPHDWHAVLDRFDRAGRHRDRRSRRSVLAVAAVIAVVGLLGVVAAFELRSGDDGDQPIDRPSTTIAGQVTDPLAGLSGDDWAVPGRLPDGYEVIVAMGTRPGNGRLLVGGDDVAEVMIITGDDRPADDAPSDADDAVDVVDVAGVDWEVRSVDDEDGNPLEYHIQRVVDDRVVALMTLDDLDVLVSMAAELRPVPDAELDVPRMSEEGAYTTVASLDDVEVTAHGVNDVYCVRIVAPDSSSSGTCGVRTEPGVPVVVAVGSSGPAGGFTAGLAEPDVALVEFVLPDGDSVVVEPTDVSGSFDQRFWLTDEPGVRPSSSIDHVIVTYDDGSTATSRRTPSGWTLVDEPRAAADPSTTVPATTVATTTVQPEDRLASWPSPPVEPTAVDAVPRLLPTAAIASTGPPVRGTADGGSAAPSTFTQVFAHADEDVLLVLQTGPLGVDSTPSAARQPVTIDGWDDAFLTDGGLRLVASDPGGFVRLTGTGVDGDEAVSIIAGMQRRADGVPGWDLSPADDGLVEINGAWDDSAGQRIATWFDGDRVVAQMLTSPAHTYLIGQALGDEFDAVDVGGAAGWIDASGVRSSIVWSPDGTTVVVLGVADDGIDPLAIARSVTEVGVEDYESATTTEFPAGVGDGCDASLFC